jgi:hypothetical protein
MVGWFGQVLTSSRATSGASPMMGTAPTRVANLCEALGIVGLARAATPVRRQFRAATLGSRVPNYKPKTILLVLKMDSNMSSGWIRG